MEMVDIQMFSVYLYLYRYSHTMVNNMNLRLLKRILTGFLLNFFIMTTTALYAQPLTEQTARLCATDFWQKKHPAHKRLVPEMVLYHAGSNGYIFVPSEEGGFVWIGGQGDAPVVKGYSTVSQIRDKAMPEILRFCLDNATIPATATKDDVFTETVSPLLTSEWEQASPYNGLCPYYKYDDGTISDELKEDLTKKLYIQDYKNNKYGIRSASEDVHYAIRNRLGLSDESKRKTSQQTSDLVSAGVGYLFSGSKRKQDRYV